MKKLAVLLFLTVVLTIPFEASALNLFGFGPRAGYYKVKDADEGDIMGGVAARLKLLGILGVEASIDYRSEEYVDGGVSVDSWPVMVTGIVYPFPLVYGLAGFGWYNNKYEYDAEKLGVQLAGAFEESVQETGWHFGAGLELPLGFATLAADIRYVFLDYDFEKLPGSKEVDSNFYMITAGLLFGF